jgi:flavin reductase (DIM6/NTAB) family NADH-FMN oxidoreductase RutF
MTIHSTDPFAVPDDQRSTVRRLRGRLPSPVTIWTSGAGPDRVGLTVSSLLVIDGDPGRIIGLIGDESELWPVIESTGRFAVIQLGAADRQMADRFAGLLPAPGGPFRDGDWMQTEYGPVPVSGGGEDGAGATEPTFRPARTWAGCRLDSARAFGWGLLIEGTINLIEFVRADQTLMHLGGRYSDIPLPE